MQLLIVSRSPIESLQTRFGGLPLLAVESTWPRCAECDEPMQFLGQLRHADDALMALFMCDNSESSCEHWDPDAGSNRVVLLHPEHLVQPEVPDNPHALRPSSYGAAYLNCDASGYETARRAWTNATSRPMRDVLGQLGGEPQWLQHDETPQCACGQPMRFIAQLEQGPNAQEEMNFCGGGCAYIFVCDDHAAKMVIQS